MSPAIEVDFVWLQTMMGYNEPYIPIPGPAPAVGFVSGLNIAAASTHDEAARDWVMLYLRAREQCRSAND